MIIFFDTVSPLPEFSLIEDNKIIYSSKLPINDKVRMSDIIISSYKNLDKNYNVNNKLKGLIVNTGPGSYTALRVGIAFLSGLSISKNIPLKGVSCIDLYKYTINKRDYRSVGIYIKSSNNQKFISYYDSYINEFKISKIENNKILDLTKLNLTMIVGNSELNLNELNFQNNNIYYKKFKFSELVENNLDKIFVNLSPQIIKPIYFSENKILN